MISHDVQVHFSCLVRLQEPYIRSCNTIQYIKEPKLARTQKAISLTRMFAVIRCETKYYVHHEERLCLFLYVHVAWCRLYSHLWGFHEFTSQVELPSSWAINVNNEFQWQLEEDGSGRILYKTELDRDKTVVCSLYVSK